MYWVRLNSTDYPTNWATKTLNPLSIFFFLIARRSPLATASQLRLHEPPLWDHHALHVHNALAVHAGDQHHLPRASQQPRHNATGPPPPTLT